MEEVRVAYIEDDPKLGRLTQQYLQSHGLDVTVYAEPEEGIAGIIRMRPDVVLLDLMLPGIDGFEVLRRLREHSDVAVIMVTARGEEADRVMGLEGGADDYVSKPFASRELLARIRAHARRARQRTQAPNRRSVAGALVVDGRARVASFRGDVVELTTYEFELLQVFVQRAGQVLTREQLVEAVRGSAEEAFDRSIDVHISNLRKKLGEQARQPRILKTVRGVGYMLVPEPR
ncbi:MAG: response regulator transcription factor [Myxococcota bacterium]